MKIDSFRIQSPENTNIIPNEVLTNFKIKMKWFIVVREIMNQLVNFTLKKLNYCHQMQKITNFYNQPTMH